MLQLTVGTRGSGKSELVHHLPTRSLLLKRPLLRNDSATKLKAITHHANISQAFKL
jgi:hypothetical protein